MVVTAEISLCYGNRCHVIAHTPIIGDRTLGFPLDSNLSHHFIKLSLSTYAYLTWRAECLVTHSGFTRYCLFHVFLSFAVAAASDHGLIPIPLILLSTIQVCFGFPGCRLPSGAHPRLIACVDLGLRRQWPKYFHLRLSKLFSILSCLLMSTYPPDLLCKKTHG